MIVSSIANKVIGTVLKGTVAAIPYAIALGVSCFMTYDYLVYHLEKEL